MHYYQIQINTERHGWIAALSFPSQHLRDAALRERTAKYPQTTYRAYDPA